MALVKVCSVMDVPAGEARRVAVGDREIAVVNLGDDGFRAVDAVCSHAHYYLDEGETGKPRALPATLPVEVFPVKIEDDDVMIEVEA
jgi:3-phenylpropionate/trans-cinnamate dioxygenase ferredoxin subunit